MSNLGTAYEQDGRHDDALPLLEETLKRRRAKRGLEHTLTLRSINNLARAYIHHEPQRAEKLLIEARHVRETRFPKDWRTFETLALLGASLLAQNRSAEAEPLLNEGYDGMKALEARIPAPSRKYVLEASAEIAQIYEARGEKSKRPNGE